MNKYRAQLGSTSQLALAEPDMVLKKDNPSWRAREPRPIHRG